MGFPEKKHFNGLLGNQLNKGKTSNIGCSGSVVIKKNPGEFSPGFSISGC
jgi:hypothetical protein